MAHEFYDDVVIHDGLEVEKIAGYDITLPQALDTVKNLQYRYMNKQPISFSYTEEKLHHFYIWSIGSFSTRNTSTRMIIRKNNYDNENDILTVGIDCYNLVVNSKECEPDYNLQLSTEVSFQPCLFDYYPDKRLIIPTVDVELPQIEKTSASVNYFCEFYDGEYFIDLSYVDLYIDPYDSFNITIDLSWSGGLEYTKHSNEKTAFNLSPQTQGECYVFLTSQIDTTNLRPVLPQI